MGVTMYPKHLRTGIPSDYNTIIERNEKHNIVSTVLAYDHGGFETMVFASDENGKPFTYADLFSVRYLPNQDPLVGHMAVVKDFYLH
jgi:hypothetical protein